MKKIFFTIMIVLAVCAALPLAASAQAETPSIVDTTIPVDAVLKADVNNWLEESAPAPYPYWAITAVDEIDDQPGEFFVSLVALNLASPDDKDWHVTDENMVRWMGSIVVHADHSVTVYSDGGYSDNQQVGTAAMKVLFSMRLDGGGSNVRFPWDSGSSMMYGTRGVHAAGGGAAYAVGFSAVDFLGGNDLGSTVASNRVYAVANGTVDYYCVDESSTLVRTENTTSGDYYIYAHFIDNTTLRTGYTYYQGDYMGSLKYGSFDDNCGWAEQTAQHYHLHFGFEPANGAFVMEGCTLSMDSEEWQCGNNKVVKIGQFLMNGWGTSGITGGDDNNAYSNMIGFWDLILNGAGAMWDQLVVSNMPDHTANQFLYALYNGVAVAVRVARVILYSNINLSHLVTAVVFSLGVKALLSVAEFVVFLVKTYKTLAPSYFGGG